jgi:hypothetical protein
MKIYFAGMKDKLNNIFMIAKKTNRLVSFIDLISKDRAYGAEDRFREIIEHNKKVKK